ncbi:MAG: TetR/AcrR family transcriptional regulator [Cyanobacteria bacterium SBLK]|nr:TetR/AcrR family transcriptional regulator [Cyanobacteria bacterium SBLK]
MARHKAFDREAVLDKAMDTFWRKGYEGTSVRDLVENMGINRGSLYDTFGDKHTLFLAAIAHYEDTIVKHALACLETPHADKQAIIDHFYGLIDRAIVDVEKRGCFVTNSAVELCARDREAATRIEHNLKRIERAYGNALKRSQDKGELRSDCDIRATARFLICTLQGLRVMTKVNCDRSVLEDIAKVALAVLQ